MAAAARVQHRRARQVLLVARAATIAAKVYESVATHGGGENEHRVKYFDTHDHILPVDAWQVEKRSTCRRFPIEHA